ncbi:hypothetical protein EPUS_00709 [Endocarpon pusillum Z07020]|uniref:Uncharacterized protein n=1 Tax=Endocarpon pusillum (strain Z07020 / HMAS-L-300199) TaxID=1263415 RepID=U1HYJ8_ENDPU|nr:uncharacterized protein EPUS_00709 [Endocarpon pusillum Z07020]ERF74579.1 hypothetical protein EPUS_00709 [Endocarpon pusillum Z07020]
MPFLYDPEDSDFDVGEYASSWSHPEPDIGPGSNSSRVTHGSDLTTTAFPSSAQTYRPADNGPFPTTSVQDPRQVATTLASIIRLILDTTSATSQQPNQINLLVAHPPTQSLGTTEDRRTIIDATGQTSRQPMQVTPTTVDSPRLTSRTVGRATAPMGRRRRTPLAEGNASTQREQYQNARSQLVIERWLIRSGRLAQLEAERISGGNSSAEHRREETDGARTADEVEQSTARE